VWGRPPSAVFCGTDTLVRALRLDPGHPECPRFSSRADASIPVILRARAFLRGPTPRSPVILRARAFLRGPKDLSLHESMGGDRFCPDSDCHSEPQSARAGRTLLPRGPTPRSRSS
jgi:hypothetical protein